MGVTGLWDVVKPVARPVKLETLNRKRLAVDASIWIYQFLKAVRDKEGNALRNSHVVGFFRRICKLLYHGIQPVFVFDGGAPVLKRQTINQRKARREGRREDMARTAGKLLAKQMQHRAEEEQRKRREARDRPVQEEELPEELLYVEEQFMTPKQRQQNRQFKKKDAYHLPELDVSLNEMGAPNDPRIMSQEELEEYARQFQEGEDINLYDFSKIDFDGLFFTSLPATDRYNILNAARLRSRLRMGYSKEQLDLMFPNRMDFSRFQIERVRERNDLTQRLMNINGMNSNDFGGGRVAGEKGREYMLVKNEGVEGGWALGVVSNKDEGKREKPIDIDKPELPLPPPGDSDDESLEDVPIEGLDRLPKRPKFQAPPEIDPAYAENAEMQEALYSDSRNAQLSKARAADQEDDDGLFVPQDDDENDFEDVAIPQAELDGDTEANDEELQRAIAMSLEDGSDDDRVQEYQRAGEAARAERLRKEKVLDFSKRRNGSGRHFASYANARAAKTAPRPKGNDDSTNPELRAAFEAGRKMGPRKKQQLEEPVLTPQPAEAQKPSVLVHPSQFKGPLPFESVDLGKSIFSKPKKKPAEEEGGFEKEKEDKPRPAPPWFAGDIDKEEYQQSHIRRTEQANDDDALSRPSAPILKSNPAREVIDLEAEDKKDKQPIELLSSDEEDPAVKDSKQVDPEVRMEDVADLVRAEPPVTELPQSGVPAPMTTNHGNAISQPPSVVSATKDAEILDPEQQVVSADSNLHFPGENSFEWEESDFEDGEQYRRPANPEPVVPAVSNGGQAVGQPEYSSSDEEFEDVAVPDLSIVDKKLPELEHADVAVLETPTTRMRSSSPVLAAPAQARTEAFDETMVDVPTIDETEDDFSDPEDEDLMRQLAEEAEEHARFATQLNIATGLQSAADYDRELKQLRNQQKAERRDADEVSQVMVTECQQLLRLFGLPYITAPMEAEAQCAELLKLGLVDGIVTDDSDIFLFGGTRVYKNMFNQAKEVQCYLAGDLEKEYGLNREKIIQIAQLLGSDYTEGIPNVGPVTALDILAEFGDLQTFQSWWTDVQTGIAPHESKGFKKKFRKSATKIFLPPGFPDPRVDQAYLFPEVDSDSSEFQWGVPDLDALRQFLMATIGWSQDRTDEILVPVVKNINQRATEGTQANITRFFGGSMGLGALGTGQDAYAPRRRNEGKSSRMENALARLHERARRAAGGAVDEEDGQGHEEIVEKPPTKKRKTRAKASKKTKKVQEEGADIDGNDDAQDDAESEADEYRPVSAARGTKKRQKAQKSGT